MPNNWKTYKLSDIGTIARGKSKHRPRDASHLYGGEFPFIQTGDVKVANHRLNCHSQTYSDAGLAQSKLWPKDTMCITIAANIAETAILNYPACFPDSIIGFIADKEKCDIDFVEYLMQHFKKEVQSHSIGSVQDNINLGTFERLNFLIPPLQEQKSIASILSAIDDKIENNLAINKTLEEMAMALYKHWFVDFGPFQDGEFVESELGRIPEGWEVKRLVEFVNLTMGQSPKSEFYNLNNEGLPFHQGVTNYGERFPEDKTYSTEGNRFAEEGDILFSVRAPVGRLNIAKNKIILGRGLSSMTLKNHDNNGFLFYSLKNFFTEDDKIGDGTVYGSVNKTELENLKFIVPCKEVLDNFNDLVKDIDSKYLNNYREYQTLTQLRDTLLPKLISGEVRLKEFRN
ncbi:restriction endonuclease subunit S [Flavobacterium celericrescens]|uniref:Restriction endonuclease subunit S n=1 Tax=Flavobacterium celericrescens TaxID=2709780 RepID=A0ABX0IFF3_9FLAO|nr:restriction endonuclease subunit S [Flavobacterium celericrescens]NHM04090.1 restriction endonuclease subunit S [Flavobacterium celericrescens]